METIISYDEVIDYSNMVLCMPSSIQGGSYFTKLQYCKNPLYVQSPTCISKQGIIHVGKKTYVDLVLTSEKDGEFISFLEHLEKKCIDIIYEKRTIWFTDELEKSDIETAFASIVKPYKNGTNHILRVNINNNNNNKHNIGTQNCFVFDEENNAVTFDSVKTDASLITIIDFEGIKFTSKSFQFELNARQILIINEKPIFKACLIKQKKQDFAIVADVAATDAVTDAAADVVAAADALVDVAAADAVADVAAADAVADVAAAVADVAAADAVADAVADVVVAENVNELNETNCETKDKNECLEESLDGATKPLIISEDKSNFDAELLEIDLDLEKNDDQNKILEPIKLNNANDVYLKMYKDAKDKAKSAKNVAIEAYLAAEEIKITYNLVDVDSDSSNSDSESESDGDSDVGEGD